MEPTLDLASQLTKEHFVPTLEASEPRTAIEEIVHRLHRRQLLEGGNKEEVLRTLHEREEKMSTGIGCGVAIPHSLSKTVQKVIIALGRSTEGINFQAPDNNPVKLVILTLIPESQKHLHLKVLAMLGRMFHQCAIRKKFETAETQEEMLDVFREHLPSSLL